MAYGVPLKPQCGLLWLANVFHEPSLILYYHIPWLVCTNQRMVCTLPRLMVLLHFITYGVDLTTTPWFLVIHGHSSYEHCLTSLHQLWVLNFTTSDSKSQAGTTLHIPTMCTHHMLIRYPTLHMTSPTAVLIFCEVEYILHHHSIPLHNKHHCVVGNTSLHNSTHAHKGPYHIFPFFILSLFSYDIVII